MDLLNFINFYLVPGVVLGSVYALSAVGITLVFSIMRHAHFAHGDLATVGAFVALAVVAGLGLSPYIGLVVAIAFSTILAVGVDKLFYEHLRDRPKILTTIASLGVALMMRSLVQVFWGVETTTYTPGISRPETWLGVRVKTPELLAVLALVFIIVALMFFLQRTKWGKAMRAMSDNRDLALLSGVDNRLVIVLTWSIVGALCAASGFFLGITTELKPMMGFNILLPAFAAAILGGVGRIEGAVIGGLLVGVIEEMSVMVIPSEYKALSSFAIILLVLLVRPTGLFKGKIL
ncbi:hypothetical protein L905_07100 [Agrobacterium sp. TS43]|uniref:branched-chain amino acid ABC transporter permease n=1 Tax=Agrobacterium TaxID=357 RepID=UPI0003724D7D|nr:MULTISPECIES: branched-chain amino acid ABC transporter permease [Agrobacterium]EPR21257.1 hypothetical protein L902_01945 [Agrobacterium radiobacter DSM 30147]KDR88545.1 amino acid ABC transporter permease [Agrobacterium tumefaciens GW4]KVK49915.1 hypothetical protein L903_18755 [Agrobacterium sp. JL28]KVK50207.1 hypothetical protein L904_18755 [Agrobacterium sp. LY4]KVK54256.1 hypothetical protein L901_17965 [Agrobacterium sp. D14]